MTRLLKLAKLPIQARIYLIEDKNHLEQLETGPFTTENLNELLSHSSNKVHALHDGILHVYQLIDAKKVDFGKEELARRKATQHIDLFNQYKVKAVEISSSAKSLGIAFAEGLALSNYQFLKYQNGADKKKNCLEEIVYSGLSDEDLAWLEAKLEGTLLARDLVNEPLSTLTAPELANRIADIDLDDLEIKVYNKAEIEEMGMGGLLAVNKGSVDPPTFTVMEYKPESAKNQKPLALIGKGVVYDTGGMSLKPTANSMDMMKCDMGGAATVVGTMLSIAKAKLPYYVKAFIPATDNRPGGNAYVPGDIIKMFNGKTVEILNTDAEGRMILADALAFAQKDEPELGISVATLTGAAAYSIGKYASVSMGNVESDKWEILDQASAKSGERHAPVPFWSDYGELVKSDIADLKNLGGPEAGAITAGKFLENFTNYPYLHLDIAGPAFHTDDYLYHPKGGSGYGVRLLAEFVKTLANG